MARRRRQQQHDRVATTLLVTPIRDQTCASFFFTVTFATHSTRFTFSTCPSCHPTSLVLLYTLLCPDRHVHVHRTYIHVHMFRACTVHVHVHVPPGAAAPPGRSLSSPTKSPSFVRPATQQERGGSGLQGRGVSGERTATPISPRPCLAHGSRIEQHPCDEQFEPRGACLHSLRRREPCRKTDQAPRCFPTHVFASLACIADRCRDWQTAGGARIAAWQAGQPHRG